MPGLAGATALGPGRTSNLSAFIKRFNKQNKPRVGGGFKCYVNENPTTKAQRDGATTKTKIHHGGTETRRRSKPIFTTEDTEGQRENWKPKASCRGCRGGRG